MTQVNQRRFHKTLVPWGLPTVSLSVLVFCAPVWALPPEDEVPEEVLRTEIITDARSPLDGQPLTAAEYAALQEALQAPPESPPVSTDIRRLIFLLQLRRAARTLIPFIP